MKRAIGLQTWFLVPTAGQFHDPEDKEPLAEESAGKEQSEELVSSNDSLDGKRISRSRSRFANIDYNHPYLNERGITEETAKKFGRWSFSGEGRHAWEMCVSHP